jgi:hypothetical protein
MVTVGKRGSKYERYNSPTTHWRNKDVKLYQAGRENLAFSLWIIK